jgi:multidrug efflux pump subunit AcrB
VSRFFINRPIVAIFMTIAGGVALLQLPISQYPHIRLAAACA